MSMSRECRRMFRGMWLLLIAMLAYALINAVSIWNYGKVDEKCQAQVCIVLGAGTSQGQISPVFQERIRHGIWLYQQGYVEKIIFTGGYGSNECQVGSTGERSVAHEAGHADGKRCRHRGVQFPDPNKPICRIEKQT